jgi:hypothetical protein
MKFCPNCKSTYADDANFCPQESCATPQGPQRLSAVAPPAAPVTDAKSRFQPGPRLGGGNTGEVYRATDTVTGAQVAYKVVASDVLPNAASFARAEREFKQLMRVQSPRIASIIDCGRAPDERLYVAMELCEGESLDKHLRGEPVPLDRAKLIIHQIGQALLEAQKAGIVHRDVAPKNVLLMPTGEVKVINFPLAKPINDRASGVAAYLSPEQVQGKPVDQRSNTYNLAALLYHLLTGEPPFQGSPETVLELHVGSPPLAPSQRRPEAGLPPEVDRVILKALDKSSSRRHLTLRLFLSEVESLVMPVTAPAAAAPGHGRDAGGFARTMLFAGGQAEVANLVAKAIAARGGSPAGGVPITPAGTMIGSGPTGPLPGAMPPPAAAAPAAAPTTGQQRRHPTPGAGAAPGTGQNPNLGIAATIAAAPPATGAVRLVSPASSVAVTPAAVSPAPSPANTGANPRVLTPEAGTPPSAISPASLSSPTPPPTVAVPPTIAVVPPTVAAMPVVTPPAAAPTSKATEPAAPAPQKSHDKGDKGKDGKFRETLWFKKGDVEHMIAEARAKIANPDGKPPEAPSPEEVLPIEDRYVDDGTVTAEDRKKFSLRAGQTAASMPTVKAKVPGESMSDADVIREVSTGSRKVVVLLVVAVLVLAAVAAVVTPLRSKPTSPPALPPAASLVPAPPAPPPAAAGPAAPAARPGDKHPDAPEVTTKKIVAAPPSKRSDGNDKRATRRKDRPKRR